MNPATKAQEEQRLSEVYEKRVQLQDRYSVFQKGHLFNTQEFERELLSSLQNHLALPLSEAKILEIGCGTGGGILNFLKWGASPENISGIDVLANRIEIARGSLPATVNLRHGNAMELPWNSKCFDIVFLSTVFTSILDETIRRQVASEILRVLKPSGFILWYDFFVNNPSNPSVRKVSKSELSNLFPNCSINLKRITLLPALARFVAPKFWWGAGILRSLKILNTHYLGSIKKIHV